MVAGHLQEKRGYFYIVLNYKDSNGKRKSKWIATSLPVKGNKRKADELLQQARIEFKPETEEPKPTAPAMAVPVTSLTGDVLFADFMLSWLDVIKRSVSPVTFSSYSEMVKGITVPYFRKTGIRLSALKPRDIQAFYDEKIKTVENKDRLRKLRHTLPRQHTQGTGHGGEAGADSEQSLGSRRSAKESPICRELLQRRRAERAFCRDKRHEAGDSCTVRSLLRPTEKRGCNTITVRHTVTTCRIDGKKVMVAADRTKNKSSMRTMPLVPLFKERLLYLQDQQNKQRKLCGGSYCRDFRGYICVDEMGVLIKPDYISAAFPKLLDRHGLRRIRFHDLRHSCASLLLAHGVPMKQIQEWLGHSDFSTTANIYSHLDYTAKLNSAETLVTSLDFALEPKLLPR